MFSDKMFPKYKQVKFVQDKSCEIHLGMSTQTQLINTIPKTLQ